MKIRFDDTSKVSKSSIERTNIKANDSISKQFHFKNKAVACVSSKWQNKSIQSIFGATKFLCLRPIRDHLGAATLIIGMLGRACSHQWQFGKSLPGNTTVL